MVLVEAQAGGKTASATAMPIAATAALVRELLADAGRRPRRDGRRRAAWCGDGRRRSATWAGRASPRWRSRPWISALWDLKARLLDLPLVDSAGRGPRGACRSTAAAASRRTRRSALQDQLAGWVEPGIPRVKMKIGRDPARDLDRVRGRTRGHRAASAELFVDANGAYSRKQALAMAETFAALGGRAGSRSRSRPTTSTGSGCCATARRPVWTSRRASMATTCLLPADARGGVDVLQADATRCCGITGFLRAGPCARRARCRCRPTAPRRCTRTPAARCRPSATSSISTITRGSSTCSSTAREPVDGSCIPTCRGLGWGSS